jgi:hypothetical protein
MSENIRINSGVTNLAMPSDGPVLQAGDTWTVSDSDFAEMVADGIVGSGSGKLVTDLGPVASPDDPSGSAAAALVSAKAYTDAQIAAIVNGAPGALDTLKELADALGDDANYAATLTAALALKAPLASPALTGNPTVPTQVPGTNSTRVANTAYADAAVAAQHVIDSGAYQPLGGTWARSSPIGATGPAVDLLMSAYDMSSATTDHTAAFQAAINAAEAIIAAGVASYVRIILDSRIKYTLSTACSTGSHNENAQVLLPFNTTQSGTIKLVGMPAGDGGYIGFGGGSHTVIECGLGSAPTYSASGGIASMFGGPSSYSTSARTMSFIRFATENITLRAATPFIAGIDAGWMAGFYADGDLIFTTDALDALSSFNIATVSVCSNDQAHPLITPLVNCYYGSIIDRLSISGWYCGPTIGEAVHIRQCRVFATNLCLDIDVAQEGSLIEQLYDWDNCVGVGTCKPGGSVTSPSATGNASHITAVIPSPLTISNWQNQLAAAAAPTALLRTFDLLDGNHVCSITAWMRSNQGGSGGGLVVRPPVIGPTAASTVTNARIYDANRAPGQQIVVCSSGTAFRNPLGRDCMILAAGGVITSAVVDGTTQPFTTIVPMRAQSVATLTFSGSPTLVALCT